MVMNWDDLRIFLAAARSGSFTGAARELRVDQSTVSRRVAALEDTLGAPLFVRNRDGLTATSLAGALMQHATRVEAEMAAALSVGQDEAGTGLVRLATTEALATTLLQSGLGALAAKHPGLHIDLITGNRTLDLAKGDADLALRLVRPREESLSVRKVGELVYALHGAPQYLAQRGAPRSSAELGGHDVIAMSGEMAMAPMAKWMESMQGTRVAMSTNSLPMLGMAIAAGLGLGVLPISWRQPGAQLERLFLIEEIPKAPIWLVSRPATKSRAAVKVVAELVARLMLQATSIA